MTLKKNDNNKYELQFKNFKIDLSAIIAILIITGFFLVLIINVGYDKDSGCYWKPADVKIDIQKRKVVSE